MESDDGPARRSTRAALAEIPLRLGMLRVSPEPREREVPQASPEPLTPINLNNLNAGTGPFTNGFGDTTRHIFTNGHRNLNITPTSSAFLSPTPSPDELVIQQRGRRRIPVNWSPDIDYRKNSPFHSNNRTPPKAVMNLQSPTKNGIVLRSTPRKRLLMTDFDKPSSSSEVTELNDMTPQKYRNQSPTKNSPAPKRFKIDRSLASNSNEPLEVVLRAMSHEQLIDILKNVTQKHSNVEEEVRNNLPLPDLKPVEEKLSYLKRNIFRSLPTSRLYSKTDSPAYSRAATHIIAFKKYLIEQGKIFVDSHNWHTVLEYAILAWSYVRGTPHWDNHPHNAVRRHCFKYLAGLCMNALKKDEFEHETMLDVQEKFESMISDSDDIRSCLKFVSVQIKTAPQTINNNNNSTSVGRRCI